MKPRSIHRLVPALALLTAILFAVPAAAQVNLLWYKEVKHDGRIYVFNDPNTFRMWEGSKDMGKSLTRIGYGPAGETCVFENENALDLYDLKHDKEAEARPYTAPKPAAPAIPTSIKVGDGELKLGALLQGWYVADDSPASTTTSYYGNRTGLHTFRIRRAEIKLSGRITPAWGFEVMLDPAKTQNFTGTGDDKLLQDLAVSFLGLKGHELSLGQKKIVITEEGVRSSSELDFAERARVTRGFSDRREMGLFYKGEYGEHLGAMASITNGTATNLVDDSNDTVFFAGRFDVKPVKGLLIGASGGYSGGEGLAHLGRTRIGAHVKYDGGEDLPIGFRAEYLRATDGQAGKDDLVRDGFYVTGLYTIDKRYQLGIRYDEIDNNKDVDGSRIKTLTAGFHYLVKGKNINLKLDYFSVKEEGRKINTVPEESYSQFVLAAQVAF